MIGVNLKICVLPEQMTNGMVEPTSRYQTSSSATMMAYNDYHHQDGGNSLSGVFDAAFSAAASTSRRGYAPANYDGMMPPSTMHQVYIVLCILPVLQFPLRQQQVAIGEPGRDE